MSLKWSVLGGSLFKLHNKTDKEINFTLRNDHNKSPKYKSANSDIYTFFKKKNLPLPKVNLKRCLVFSLMFERENQSWND